jgi:benzoyl-CoA reductase subunit C
MMKNMAKFHGSINKPYERIAEWKEKNKKLVVGVLPMYFPEEIIHACGALPIVLQESDELITLGSRHMDSSYCRFVRGITDLAVKGKLNFLDLLIVPDTCVQQRGIAHVLRHSQSNVPVELIQLPRQIGTESALEHAERWLEKIRLKMEQLTNNKLSDDQIAKSISVYGENRALLTRLYALRKTKPGVLQGREVMEIVQSSMVIPKEEHSGYLRALLAELEETKTPAQKRVRLCVSGHFCAAPMAGLLDLIEEEGAFIVDDDLFTGFRYFGEEVAPKGSSIHQLAERYVYRTVPDPTRFNPENDWRTYLIRLVRSAPAQGIILLIRKCCDPHLIWYPDLRDALSAANIPCLMIETGYEDFSLAEEKTKIRKFIAMIKR